MEAVNEKDQRAEPTKINSQAWVDRDIYFAFRDLMKSHKISMGQGVTWAMRSILLAAGVKVRRDRGMREQQGDSSNQRRDNSTRPANGYAKI